MRIFKLHYETHNYIVNNLVNNIVVQLERRVCKFIHAMLHSDNDVVRSVMTTKLECPSSIMAGNYRLYISYKYNVYDHDWYGDMT